ncbi:MAG TPA: hypothetical protein PKE14_01210, partial [Chitinophagales bacterium]|nr:hypothetical protein [Chitinophagales bacterium]
MLKFVVRLIIFAVVLAIVLLILGMVSEFKPAMTFAWMCFGMFFALTLITYFFSAKTMERKFSSFMNVFFVGIFSKLILSAIMVLIFKVKNETTGL